MTSSPPLKNLDEKGTVFQVLVVPVVVCIAFKNKHFSALPFCVMKGVFKNPCFVFWRVENARSCRFLMKKLFNLH